MSLLAPTEPGFMAADNESIAALFAHHDFPAMHPVAILIPRLSQGEQETLTASIRRMGDILEEVTLFDGKIADGVGRCVSAITVGKPWQQVRSVQFEGREDSLLDFVLDKNLARRNLGPSQNAMVAARLATMRQGERTDLRQICRRSQEQAARRLGISTRIVTDAVAVLKKGIPELVRAVDRGILPVSAAIKVINLAPGIQCNIITSTLSKPKPSKAFMAVIRNTKTKSRHRDILANARLHDLAGKRYLIILVDPPWEGRVSWIGSPFPRLSIPQLKEFRLDDGRLIREVAADDAILLVWILDNVTFEIPELVRSWGFEPHFPMHWPKSTFGTGHFVRYQHETVWVCIRGNFRPPLEHLRPSSLIVGPPLTGGGGFHFAPAHDARHSSKPDRLQEMIEQAYPEYFGPETIKSPFALELFARNYRPKWDGQGFEYPGRPAVLATEPDAEIRIRHAEDDHPEGG